MKATVTVTGIDNVYELNRKISQPSRYINSVDELVIKTTELIRRYAPRKTGRLEMSIYSVKMGEDKWEIVVNVPYAVYVEYGTIYFPVGTVNAPIARTSTSGKPCFHPFMRPAIWEMMLLYPNIFKKVLFSK